MNGCHKPLQHALPPCQQVTFENNKGGGPTVYLSSGATIVTTGSKTSFRFNTATSRAAGVSINSGGSLTVNGPFCAQNNSGQGAGFLDADLTSGAVRFSQPATAYIAGNTPSDIFSGGDSYIFCGDSSTGWRQGTFTITGNVCACNDAFSNSSDTTTTCNSCALGWSESTCSCKVGRSVVNNRVGTPRVRCHSLVFQRPQRGPFLPPWQATNGIATLGI